MPLRLEGTAVQGTSSTDVLRWMVGLKTISEHQEKELLCLLGWNQ